MLSFHSSASEKPFRAGNKMQSNSIKRGAYGTKKWLGKDRLNAWSTHTRVTGKKHQYYFCSWLYRKKRGQARRRELEGLVVPLPKRYSSKSVRQTTDQCSNCRVNLCRRSCFQYYHRVLQGPQRQITGLQPAECIKIDLNLP